MQKLIRVLLVAVLVGLFVACSSEQIKKMGDILPKVLSNVTQAYGNPYGALIGSFFNLITDKDSDKKAVSVSQPKSPTSESGQGYYQAGSQQPQSSTSGSGQGYYQSGSQQTQSSTSGSGQGYYQAQPQSTQAAAPYQTAGRIDSLPLEVSIDVVKEKYVNGRYQAVPVANGDTLTQQDNYKILFQSNSPCYMYIAQLDATGKLDPILPSRFTSYRNPIRPGTMHDVPSGTNWFYLDANFGVETIYFIASQTPRPDIEQLFSQLEATNRTLIQQNQVSMDSAYVVTRGIGGMRPGSNQPVSFQNGSQGQFTSTLIQSIQADFVMTRWFHHR